MRQAKVGDSVRVHYNGKLEDGTEFDSSEGFEPLKFEIGEGFLLPLFEQAIVGMGAGDSKTIKIPADQAYGQYLKELVVAFDKSQLPPNIEPKVGLELQIDESDGWQSIVRIVDMDDTFVWVDANHPLAGKDLTFNISLLEII